MCTNQHSVCISMSFCCCLTLLSPKFLSVHSFLHCCIEFHDKNTQFCPHTTPDSLFTLKKKLDLFIVGYGMRARHDACVEVRGQLLGLSLRPSPNPPSLRIKHRLLSLGTGAFICCVTVGCGVCTCMVHVYSWRTRVKMVSLRASTLSAVSTLSH